MNDILIVILWAALIQGLFLALMYIFSKKKRSFANFLLGMFLISLLLEALTTILPYSWIGSYSLNEYFALPEVKLFIPLFFVHFVLEKLGSSFRYQRFLKINYAIALAISSLTLVNLILFYVNASSLTSAFGAERIEDIHLTLQTYAFIIVICAFVISIVETLRYRNLVRNEYSDIALLRINWLWQFIFMLLPATILWGIDLTVILISGRSPGDFVLITWGFVALFLYFLSYKAYRHENLFDEFPKSVLLEDTKHEALQKHRGSELREQIETRMKEDRYYLNPDLTLNTFASEIDLTPRVISTYINRQLGRNFNEWVNDYRVDAAVAKINSDTENTLSIEGIGSDSGFKSRSAMYAAFKKKLGCSPGQFRSSK